MDFKFYKYKFKRCYGQEFGYFIDELDPFVKSFKINYCQTDIDIYHVIEIETILPIKIIELILISIATHPSILGSLRESAGYEDWLKKKDAEWLEAPQPKSFWWWPEGFTPYKESKYYSDGSEDLELLIPEKIRNAGKIIIDDLQAKKISKDDFVKLYWDNFLKLPSKFIGNYNKIRGFYSEVTGYVY
jgi:hypothetical protein